MIGSHKVAVGKSPAVIWWREIEHTETSAVMFREIDGRREILDTGVAGDTYLAANPRGDMLAVWAKVASNGSSRICLYDPLTEKLKVELSQDHASAPAAALDGAGGAFVVWQRIKGKARVIEGAFSSAWREVKQISGPGWTSRPCACAVEKNTFFAAWDELSPSGGSVLACFIKDNGKTIREIEVFPREKPGLRYINTACACSRDRILIGAIRTEDVISPYGVIDQHHEVAFAVADVKNLSVKRFSPATSLDHALLSDQELQTNLWGYMGNRLKVHVLSTGRVLWERKEHHDGFTDTDRALGVLCFKDFDLQSGTWSDERILHRGSYAYDVGASEDGGTWVLHRSVVQEKTHQLAIEKVIRQEQKRSRYNWLFPKTYKPVELPFKREKDEHKIQVGEATLRLYWGDTHVHSSLSVDPEGEPDELLHYARDLAQLDFVALTDNDYLYTSWLRRWDRIRASELAEVWTEDGKFVALEGFEYTRPALVHTPRNHRTVLVRKRGGLLFRWSDPVRKEERSLVAGSDHRNIDGLKAEAERIDALLIAHHGDWVMTDSKAEVGIEAVSGWDTYIHNAELIRKVWNSGKKRCLIGGSDGHRRNAGLGGACTGVWAVNLTHEEILDGIAQRRTIVSQGRRPLIDFRLCDDEGNQLFIGDSGKLEGGITAHITVEVEKGFDDRIQLVELLHRERTLGNWGSGDAKDGSQSLEIDFPLRGFDSIAKDQVLKLEGPKYLYLRVRFSGPDHQFPSNVAPARGPWAWTTPIWWT